VIPPIVGVFGENIDGQDRQDIPAVYVVGERAGSREWKHGLIHES
jgi:hypothetical protein